MGLIEEPREKFRTPQLQTCHFLQIKKSSQEPARMQRQDVSNAYNPTLFPHSSLLC